MKREDLKKLGLSDEQIEGVMSAHGKDITSLQEKVDICQLVWLTKNTSYENVGGIFLRKNTIDS